MNYGFFIRAASKIKSCLTLRGVSGGKYQDFIAFEKTLTGRLLLHMNKSAVSNPNVEEKIRKLDSLPELQKLLQLKRFDSNFAREVGEMDAQTILQLLNSYMNIEANKMLQYKFYNSAMHHMENTIEFLSKAEILQFMFYVGLQKKNYNASMLLRKCLKMFKKDEINELPIEDLCIICNSTFKTSTKITNVVILDKVFSELSNNLHIMKDPALFITLIKTLRHNRFQNEDLLSTISCTILFNSTCQYYSFGAICHILAVYADYFYYDEPILKLFKEKCLELLKQSTAIHKTAYLTENIRPKDIKRFLWAYSNFGYKFEDTDFSDVIVPKIIEKINNGDYEIEPETLLDSIFYMRMLKYSALELMSYCFTNENIITIRAGKTKTKERLNALLSIIQLEDLPLFKRIGVRQTNFNYFDMKKQINMRPLLMRVQQTLKLLKNKDGINKFEYECAIPHIKIVGITGYKKNIYKSVFIEVLDEHVCVKNKEDYANGLMQVKLRILDDMDQALIIVPSAEIESMTDDELKDYLESEIKMVC